MVKSIYLIGFMGVGKSTVGMELAKQLNFAFLDSDVEIEKEQEQTISAIFQHNGEADFRALETAWLLRNKLDKTVFSMGGGAFGVAENRDVMLNAGTVIYLQASADKLTERLMNDATERPLIAEFRHNFDQLKKRVSHLLELRQSFYQQAHFTVNADNPLQSVVHEIMEIAQR
jgi:shikimate kinase